MPASPAVLESRVTRLEAIYDTLREDVREHDADIRQLRDWHNEVVGATREILRYSAQRLVIFGLLLTAINVGVSLALK